MNLDLMLIVVAAINLAVSLLCVAFGLWTEATYFMASATFLAVMRRT